MDVLRPISNLSVLNDLVREEMSPVADESRKKSALKSSAGNKANRGDPTLKRVRFDESVNKKVREQDYRVVIIQLPYILPFSYILRTYI